MNEEIDIALSRLEGVKKSGDGFVAKCPCHHDLHQSLSIHERNGKCLIYCHAGCDYKDIKDALGLTTEKREMIEEAVYDYVSEDGKLVYQVVRYQGKNFKQRRANGEWSVKGIEPLLYKLPEIIEAVKNNLNIFIVEGEKDVGTLNSNNIIATTLSGGANKRWTHENIKVFLDANVILIPDNDSAGRKYMEYVASLLYGWCNSLKLLKLDIHSGNDVTDYLQDHDALTLLNIAANSPEYTPIGAVTRDEFNALKGHATYLQRKLNTLLYSTSKQYNKKRDII